MSVRCELCLTLDVGTAASDSLSALLAAALDAARVSSVVLRPVAGEKLTAAIAKSLVDVAQRKSVAALLADDADLVRIVKADGVHVSWAKDVASAYHAARESLGERFIVGADAGRSRHDAMTLGEAGADYVAFGVPPHVEDRATAAARQVDLIGWWSEIFEVPCIAADVVDAAHAQSLASAGSDFIAVTLPAHLDAAGARAWLAPFARAVAAPGKAA
ncbi:MAG: thiamine phosphate synthase [Hyphomicrobium sp.]